MKTYEPAKAASLLKTGPSGRVYHFIKEHEVGPKTLADARWMENLVADNVLQVVTDLTPEEKKSEKPEPKVEKKAVTSKDVLPELEDKKILRDPGRKTKEQKDAEIKLAKQNEEAKKVAEEKKEDKVEFEDEQQQEFLEFIKSHRGKSYDDLVKEIKLEYNKDPLVELAEKFGVDSEGTKAEIASRILDIL